MVKARVAINGFGRIGRLFLRVAFGLPDIEIVAINDLGDVENLAYLLKYDTVYGRYAKDVKADTAGGKLVIDGAGVKFLQVKDPTQLAVERPCTLISSLNPRDFSIPMKNRKCILRQARSGS